MSVEFLHLGKWISVALAVPVLLVGTISVAGSRPEATPAPSRTVPAAVGKMVAPASPMVPVVVAAAEPVVGATHARKVHAPSPAINKKNGFVLLSEKGSGYYHYAGGDDPKSDAWGGAATIQCIEDAAHEWKRRYPHRPDIGVGDISLRRGGRFPPHQSHRKGIDFDVRPLRKRGTSPVSVGRPGYSREYTRDMIKVFIDTCQVRRVYFNDLSIARSMDKISTHPGHHNHVHFTVAPSKRSGKPTLAAASRRTSPAKSYK